MATIPARTKVYSTRSNIPIYDNSSAAGVSKSVIWNLKACLMDQVTSGSLTGVRDSSSVWTCRYSCTGAVSGTVDDGVDRWGSSYTPGNITQAASTSNHSWIVLHNSASACDILISTNSATASSFRVALSKNGFSGGGLNWDPTATDVLNFGSTSQASTTTAAAISDTATGNFNWCHFTTSTDGQFFFTCSRTGLGIFTTFICFIQTTNADASDTRNQYTYMVGSTSGRGVPVEAGVSSTSFSSLLPNASAVTSAGGPSSTTFGATKYTGTYGVDALTGNYLVFPIFAASLAAQIAFRGQFPDMFYVGTATVGSAYPSGSNYDLMVVGDLLIPMTGSEAVAPTI